MKRREKDEAVRVKDREAGIPERPRDAMGRPSEDGFLTRSAFGQEKPVV